MVGNDYKNDLLFFEIWYSCTLLFHYYQTQLHIRIYSVSYCQSNTYTQNISSSGFFLPSQCPLSLTLHHFLSLSIQMHSENYLKRILLYRIRFLIVVCYPTIPSLV